MTFTAFQQIKEQIKEDVLYILDFIRQDRSFLNKHFQNSINNYFLEDYAGNFLKEALQMPRAKDITKYIQNKYMDTLKGTKYMKLMSGYIQELKEANQINQFKSLLTTNMMSESYDTNKDSKEWQSNVWKRAFSLFVHHFCQMNNDNLKGIFEIWNSLFPNSKILRKRQENVNHRPREFEEQEINNVRQPKSNKPQIVQTPASQQMVINNANNLFFGGDFQTGIFMPQYQRNEYHLKPQYQPVVNYAPMNQQYQQESQNVSYAPQQQVINNNIIDEQDFFADQQQHENIEQFFTNYPEDLLDKSDSSSSPISSAPHTMNNINQYEQQQEVMYEQQQYPQIQYQQVQQQQQQSNFTLSRNNSYKQLNNQINSNNLSYPDNQFQFFPQYEQQEYQNVQSSYAYYSENISLDNNNCYIFNQIQQQN